MLKIVVIGAGSSYTPELIEGLIKRSQQLPLEELVLVDIETGKEKLDIIYELTKRMFEKANIKIKLWKTLNYKEALENADFVLTQIRVGQLEARIRDERIPLSHGFLGQETNGAGGLLKGLRTIPVILDIAENISKICPEAWMINFTNPAGMLAEAMAKYSVHRKFIGVCNVPIGIEREMAEMFKVEPNDISIDFLGLNHFVYGFNVFVKNENRTEEAIDLFCQSNMTMKNIENKKWLPEFIKALKVLPCSYHRYYFKRETMLQTELENFKTGKTRGETVKALETELFELYKDINLSEKPKLLEERGGAYYSDAACNLVNSIYNNLNELHTVSTLNQGSINDFDNNTTIEVSSFISKDGAKPKKIIDELPIHLKGGVQQIKQFECLGAKAAVEGDYNSALLALVTNPLIYDDFKAKEMLDEMLEANKEFLPNFFR